MLLCPGGNNKFIIEHKTAKDLVHSQTCLLNIRLFKISLSHFENSASFKDQTMKLLQPPVQPNIFFIEKSDSNFFQEILNIQSRLSYVTLQGTLMKRSHMTGGLLIQSPQNDLEDRQCMTSKHFQNRTRSLAVLYALSNMYMYKL